MPRFLLTLCLGAGLLSCAPGTRKNDNQVIDIDSLIDLQLVQFDRLKPTLHKQGGVNETVSDTTFSPSSYGWKSELEIFRSLGVLNQPVYSGAFLTEGPLDDPRSNLMILQYSLKEAPLKWLKVYYQDEPGRIRQVEGQVEDLTPLNASSRRLTLWFDDVSGLTTLSRYEINGYQKVALRDTVKFMIKGTVLW